MKQDAYLTKKNHHNDTARSLKDETRNGEGNADRNPEFWGYFNHL